MLEPAELRQLLAATIETVGFTEGDPPARVAQGREGGAAPRPWLRFPAIHGEQIVFSYAGDLYTARPPRAAWPGKLTSHVGYEMFARFSPDGKWIAFTGHYDGNTEVYLMPAEGGPPAADPRQPHAATTSPTAWARTTSS